MALKLNIKRIDPDLPIPQYQTSGSIGFDLVARVDTTLKPWEVTLIPLNVVVEIPKGFGLFVVPRSSTPKKKGLLIPHGIGVIDQDYCGEKDELLLQVINFTKDEVTVSRGERIAQAVLVKVETPEIVEITSVSKKSRGGVGSTG